jgi:hypothetical protein
MIEKKIVVVAPVFKGLLKRLQQNCANVGKMYKAITLKNVDYNF